MLSCAHNVSCDSPGEFGKLSSASNKSAWPTLGVHSAWACQAARSSVHDSGLHSSELAVRLANEYVMPCRTRSCSLWLMMRLKMAWAPGAVLPNCSSTTGVMPSLQRLQVVSIALAICPAFGHFFSEKFSGNREVRADGVDLDIQPQLRALRLNDVYISPSGWVEHCPGQVGHHPRIWSGMSIACSAVAVRPACRASFVMRSRIRSCLRVCRPLVQQAACLPYESRDVLASLSPRGGAPTLLTCARGRET